MKYRRFEDVIIVRIDRGEEITEQLKNVCEAEQVRLASVQALGAVNDFTVGVFNTSEKSYHANHFTGTFEIVSLTGTVSTRAGAFYQHLHMSAGDEKGAVYGGHLNSVIVSATCEMVIQVINGQMERYFDETIGLNLFRFD